MNTAKTDAYILMQFGANVAHLKPAVLAAHGKAPAIGIQEEIKAIGTPTVRALQANGHDLATAISLMRAVLYTI